MLHFVNMYNDEQKQEIRERVEKAGDLLKELKLAPAAHLSKVAVGDDTYADKVLPYLQDTKYVLEGDHYVEAH